MCVFMFGDVQPTGVYFYIAGKLASFIIIFNNTMSQVDHVIGIIDGILLSKDKNVRESAEKTLV